MDFSQHVIERFWRKVDKSAGPDGCWPWLARIDRHGYGKFRIFDGNTGKVSAHRVSLILSAGLPTPEKPMALHSCDNPCCCNPSHLRWGNNLDNVRDKYSRNRAWFSHNTEHAQNKSRIICKLNPSQADYIKRLSAAGYTIGECENWYDVSPSTILRLITGKTKGYADTAPLNTNPTKDGE